MKQHRWKKVNKSATLPLINMDDACRQTRKKLAKTQQIM